MTEKQVSKEIQQDVDITDRDLQLAIMRLLGSAGWVIFDPYYDKRSYVQPNQYTDQMCKSCYEKIELNSRYLASPHMKLHHYECVVNSDVAKIVYGNEQQWVEWIKSLTYEELGMFMRFAPSEHPVIRNPIVYLIAHGRFAKFGGWQTALSKRIGWDETLASSKVISWRPGDNQDE